MNAKLPPNITDLKPRITVIGVGGAGCNAVNNMIDANLDGVDFVVANTDAQSLVAANAPYKIQLGAKLTEGLGAGSRPDIGEAAAEETIDEIRDLVRGSHMVFVAAGMGGGTGTGAAAVIARAAKEQNILTVAVVTKPFQFEGARRMRIAEAGIAELKKHVDTLIVIPNQNLFRIASERTTFAEAFVLADQVLYSGVACIVDLIVKEGLINLDFADVRTVMSGMGSAMMGTGEAAGEGRATRAAEEAITNPLLDDVTLSGAKGLLLSITGGADLTLYEVDEAATRVRQEVDPDANIIVGATFDPSLGDRVRVSIVASGMDRAARAEAQVQAQTPLRAMPPVPPAVPMQPHIEAETGAAQDRLAEALKSPAYEALSRAPAEPPRQPAAPLSAAPPSRLPGWHSADDVEITDLPPARWPAPTHRLRRPIHRHSRSDRRTTSRPRRRPRCAARRAACPSWKIFPLSRNASTTPRPPATAPGRRPRPNPKSAASSNASPAAPDAKVIRTPASAIPLPPVRAERRTMHTPTA